MEGEKSLQQTMWVEEAHIGEKRKFEECVKRKIFIFVTADKGYMYSGIFEFDVKIFTTTSGVVDEKKPTIELQTSTNSNNIIQPTETFFLKKTGPSSSVIPMTQVGACVVGDELFMIPDDRSYHHLVQQIPLIIFNLIKKSFPVPSRYPLERKINPLLTAVGGVVYALSFFDDHVEEPFPEPWFESFNPSQKDGRNEWSTLRCPPFQDKCYEFKGHAVLGEKFILVCLERDVKRSSYIHPILLYSYNIATGYWKTVAVDNEGEGDHFPVLIGKGAVLGNDVYMFHPYPPGIMEVFSYSLVVGKDDDDDSVGADIKLSLAKQVHCLKLDGEWSEGYSFRPGYDPLYGGSSGLAIVKDRILCLLYPLYVDPDRAMLVCGLFFQLEGRESCTTLKSFRCRLMLGDQLSRTQITFVTVLNPEETNDNPPVKRNAVQSDMPMDLAS